MTATTHTARLARNTQTAAAEQVLRDVAYVLKLTRRLKEELMAEQRPAQIDLSRKTERVLIV